MPFHGIHDHTLDAKNRLTVPSKARALLANGVTVAKGLSERCLEVWPSDQHSRLIAESMAGMNPLSPEARELKRFFFGNATTMELDSAGRISVTPDQLAHAGLTKGVKVVGAGDCLELWDEAAWNEQNDGLNARAADHIQNLGHPA